MFSKSKRNLKVRSFLSGVSRATDPYPNIRVRLVTSDAEDKIGVGFSKVGREFNRRLIKSASEKMGVERVSTLILVSHEPKKGRTVLPHGGLPKDRPYTSVSGVSDLETRLNVKEGRDGKAQTTHCA